MWHKAIWKGHPMRLELTRVGLLVQLANHYTTRSALHITVESHYKQQANTITSAESLRRCSECYVTCLLHTQTKCKSHSSTFLWKELSQKKRKERKKERKKKKKIKLKKKVRFMKQSFLFLLSNCLFEHLPLRIIFKIIVCLLDCLVWCEWMPIPVAQLMQKSDIFSGLVGFGYSIHRLHLCRGVRLPQRMSSGPVGKGCILTEG